ncbi:MAG: hypothetical protein JNG84_01500 [Archangium sp.]|nr:hypothetical protein [Archangium sp.]
MAASLLLAGCPQERSKRTVEALAELQKKKDAAAKAKNEDKLAPLAEDQVKLAPPFDDASSQRLAADGPCPDGLWALFPGSAPGASPEEKKANEGQRAALAAGLRGKHFMLRFRSGGGITLRPYDAPEGRFPIDVVGTIDCTDAQGRVAIAWTKATAGDPLAATQGKAAAGEARQNYWMAESLHFFLPMPSMLDAKAFDKDHRLGLSARVVIRFDKAEVDKKLIKVGKVTQKAADTTVGYGGGTEDWGAGRLVHATIVGVRVATDQERTQLIEQRELE